MYVCVLKNISIQSDLNVKTTVIDYIMAGVDTIGNSIVFAIAQIASNTECQTRLRTELESFSPNGDFGPEMIDKLVYLKVRGFLCLQGWL